MRGRALLMATSRYSDPGLPPLPSATVDAQGLQQVLADPRIGDFEALSCVDVPCQEWRQQIASFFAAGTRDDLLLLYVSGHGVKDREGRLYFAATDTRVDLLLATGISSSFIQEAAGSSRSRQVLMILDTCFSGAFARGVQLKSGSQAVNVGEYFAESGGRVVITASDSLQYALAGGSTGAEVEPSLLSKYIIQGLRSGEADVDGDGLVCTQDLLQYVTQQVRGETPLQRPQRWAFGLTGDLVLATNPTPRAGELPRDIQLLMENSLVEVRLLAMDKLQGLLEGESRPLALAARQALEKLLKDDSRAVSAAAAMLLQKAGRGGSSSSGPETLQRTAPVEPPVVPRPPRGQVPPSPEPRPQPRPVQPIQPVQPVQPPPRSVQDTMLGQQQGSVPREEERRWARLAHLSGVFLFLVPLCSFLGPLGVWRMHRGGSAFVVSQAKEAFNFHLCFVLLELLLSGAMGVVGEQENGAPGSPPASVTVLFGTVIVGWLIFSLFGAYQAGQGVNYRYPITVRWVK